MYKKETKQECGDDCVTFRTRKAPKEEIIEEMKKRGFRITSQRSLILDVIISSEYTCCKEIFYQVNRIDHRIGIATIYRMVKTLEEMGVIDRRNLYRISKEQAVEPLEGLECELEDERIIRLSRDEIKLALSQWLKHQGISVEYEIVDLYQCAIN